MRTRKLVTKLDLINYQTAIQDVSPTSDYFRISNLASTLTGGRNSFLIAGSNLLQPNTPVVLEILDARGNPIYHSVVSNYSQARSRLISIEVFSNAEAGFGTITILGVARKTINGQRIPLLNTKDFNVKWIKEIQIDPLSRNTSPLIFRKNPTLSVEENRFYNTYSSSAILTKVPFTCSLSPLFFSADYSGYRIDVVAPSTFSSDHYGAVFTGSLTINTSEPSPVKLPITDILNSSTAYTYGYTITGPEGKIPYLYLTSGSYITQSTFGTEYKISSSVKLEYYNFAQPTPKTLISYAKLRITDLNTISGEAYKARIYSRMYNKISTYTLLSDVMIGSPELLTTSSNIGYLPIGNIKVTPTIENNWYAGELALNASINAPIYPVSGSSRYYNTSSGTGQLSVSSSNFPLLSSIFVNVPIDLSQNKFSGIVSSSGYFLGTNSGVILSPTTEYTLKLDVFNTLTSQSITLTGNTPSVDIYLIEVGGTTYNNVDPLGQKIGTINNAKSWYQDLEFNFVPKTTIERQFGVRFVVKNGFWYFSNISLKPAVDISFSPDETILIVPTSDFKNQLMQYKVEFFDINNNSTKQVTVSPPVFFVGSNMDMGVLA